MKRPDYRTLQALDAVIRERGFERAAQKLCITQSAVSQRIKQLENLFGQPLLVRTVPPRPTEQGQKLLALLHQVELLEEEWLGNDTGIDTPLLLSLAVNADSLATWLLPALKPVLTDSPIRLNLQVEDETRTQERLRRGEVVGAVSIQPLPGRPVGCAGLSVCRLEGFCRALLPERRHAFCAAKSAGGGVRPSR